MHVLNAQKLIQLPLTAVPSLPLPDEMKATSFWKTICRTSEIVNAGKCVSKILKLLITCSVGTVLGFYLTNM